MILHWLPQNFVGTYTEQAKQDPPLLHSWLPSRPFHRFASHWTRSDSLGRLRVREIIWQQTVFTDSLSPYKLHHTVMWGKRRTFASILFKNKSTVWRYRPLYHSCASKTFQTFWWSTQSSTAFWATNIHLNTPLAFSSFHFASAVCTLISETLQLLGSYTLKFIRMPPDLYFCRTFELHK